MLHCRSKLGLFLGIAVMLMVQLADGRRHSLNNLHRARRSSGAVELLVNGDKEQGHDEYHDEDSFDVDSSMEDPINFARQHQKRDRVQRHRPLGNKEYLNTQRRPWTDEDRKKFENRPLPLDYEGRDYQFDVRDAQNITVCNYTVIPIPNPGGRIPRELEHVKCNHVGSRCQERGPYCCIQLYRFIEVVYEGGKNETMKLFTGCACSLQMYGTLEPYTPKLDGLDY